MKLLGPIKVGELYTTIKLLQKMSQQWTLYKYWENYRHNYEKKNRFLWTPWKIEFQYTVQLPWKIIVANAWIKEIEKTKVLHITQKDSKERLHSGESYTYR